MLDWESGELQESTATDLLGELFHLLSLRTLGTTFLCGAQGKSILVCLRHLGSSGMKCRNCSYLWTPASPFPSMWACNLPPCPTVTHQQGLSLGVSFQGARAGLKGLETTAPISSQKGCQQCWVCSPADPF